jgi:hypothetical protein
MNLEIKGFCPLSVTLVPPKMVRYSIDSLSLGTDPNAIVRLPLSRRGEGVKFLRLSRSECRGTVRVVSRGHVVTSAACTDGPTTHQKILSSTCSSSYFENHFNTYRSLVLGQANEYSLALT